MRHFHVFYHPNRPESSPIWPFLEKLPEMSAFRSEADLPEHAVKGLYLLLDGTVVVYVGQSAGIRDRLRTHKREATKPFTEARWWRCDDESDRLRIEAVLILSLLPRYNRGLFLGFSAGRTWEVRYGRGAKRKKAGPEK